MRINRYTRTAESRFNPLSAQEIFTVPLARQKQHDEAQAQLDELGLFDINRLNQDNDIAKEYIDSYKSKIDSQVDDIFRRGVNNQTTRQLRSLISDKNKWLSNDGEGGKIVGNYNSFQNYKKGLDESLKKGDIGNNRYQALLNQATSEYQGVRGDGRLNLEAAANRVDVGDKLRTYAKDIMSNPDVLEQNTGFKYDPSSGMFINAKTKTTLTQKDLIDQVLTNMAYTDPEITNYLSQRERLGLGSMESTLKGITGSLNAGYSVNKKEQSLTGKFMPEWMRNTGNTPPGGIDTNYEFLPDTTLQIRNDELSDRLDKIISGETHSNVSVLSRPQYKLGGEGPVNPNYRQELEAYNEARAKGGKKYQLDDYKDEYDNIAQGLLESGVIPNGTNLNGKEAMNYVKEYVENRKKITYKPKIFTGGLFKTYDNLDSKMKITNPKDLFKNISAQIDNRLLIDPETKEVVKFKDLSNDEKELFNKGKGIVTGVYSSENFLRDEIVDPSADDILTSPYQVKLENGKKYIVGRGRGERDSKSYKVDTEYNKIWRQINKYPNLPQKTQLPRIGQVSITKLQDGRIIMNRLDEDGNIGSPYTPFKDDQALHNFMMLSEGITVGIEK